MAAVAADERHELIERYLPLAGGIARRFAGRTEALDDLRQVAALALIKAIDRRDPTRSTLLPAYLARCVDGELRRHLRDRAAVVRVPRTEQLLANGNGSPLAWEEVSEGASDDDELDTVVLDRALVSSAAQSLTRDERRVVLLRFFLDLSQTETGAVEGVSQAQVSRLQRRALEKMRASLAGAEPSQAR